MTAMTVADLILLLQQKPQHLPVVYACYSESALLEASDISIGSLSTPRDDGWVHHARPDKPQQEYLLFPGN